MDIRYKRKPNGTYLMLSDENWKEPDDYSLEMVLHNRIPGLLELEREQIDGRIRLFYQISSRQSLASFLEQKQVTEELLSGFLYALKNCIERLEEYLLDPDMLILKPALIFLDPDRKKFFFCFNPFSKGFLQEELRDFFDLVPSCIDLSDKDLVWKIYKIHLIQKQENFRIDRLCAVFQAPEEEKVSISFQSLFSENEPEKESPEPVPDFLKKKYREFPSEWKDPEEKKPDFITKLRTVLSDLFF